MNTEAIRQKLHQFIDTLEDKKAEAIYTLFEEDIDRNEWDYTEDFEAALNQRNTELESGQVKGSNWEEVKQRTRQL